MKKLVRRLFSHQRATPFFSSRERETRFEYVLWLVWAEEGTKIFSSDFAD